MDLYDINSLQISRLTTRNYSTSFSMGVALLGKAYRNPVYAIYGFVRVADEIVDTFHDHDKETLLAEFKQDTFNAIKNRISSNPILHSFQWVVNEYKIGPDLINAFLDSMEMDLTEREHDEESFKKYVYGSAEVVGLMCLRVFYKDEEEAYESLIYPARKLGEAFQKINFLRDIRSDYHNRGRFYFPGINLDKFDDKTKKDIEKDIQFDFDEALKGIRRLNKASKLGVLVSYTYYTRLFKKIKRTSAEKVFSKRYRISDFYKALLLISLWIKCKIGIC